MSDVSKVAYGLPASGILFPPLKWSNSMSGSPSHDCLLASQYEAKSVILKQLCRDFVVFEVDSDGAVVGTGHSKQKDGTDSLAAAWLSYTHPVSAPSVLKARSQKCPVVSATKKPLEINTTSVLDATNGDTSQSGNDLLSIEEQLTRAFKQRGLPLIFDHRTVAGNKGKDGETPKIGFCHLPPPPLPLEAILPCLCLKNDNTAVNCSCQLSSIRKAIRSFAINIAARCVHRELVLPQDGTEAFQIALMKSLLPTDDHDSAASTSEREDSILPSVPIGVLSDNVVRSFVRMALRYRYPFLDCHSLGSPATVTLLPSETFFVHCKLFSDGSSGASNTVETLMRLTRASLLLTLPPFVVLAAPAAFRGSAPEDSTDVDSAFLGISATRIDSPAHEPFTLNHTLRESVATTVIRALVDPKAFPPIRLSFGKAASKDDRGAFHDGFRKIYGGPPIWRKTVVDGVLQIKAESAAASKVLSSPVSKSGSSNITGEKRAREAAGHDNEDERISKVPTLECQTPTTTTTTTGTGISAGSLVAEADSSTMMNSSATAFTHFIAYKCNMDFMEMRERLADAFSSCSGTTGGGAAGGGKVAVLPPHFTFAGIKDKAAITAQRVSVKGDFSKGTIGVSTCDRLDSTTNTQVIPTARYRAGRAEVISIVAKLMAGMCATPCNEGKDMKEEDRQSEVTSLTKAMLDDISGVSLVYLDPTGSSWLLLAHRQVRSYPIALGDLKGNRFAINAKVVGAPASSGPDKEKVTSSAADCIAGRINEMSKLLRGSSSHNEGPSITSIGFPNHFGTQRFGMVLDATDDAAIKDSSKQSNIRVTFADPLMDLYSCRTADYLASLNRHIGIYLIEQDWSKAVDALLFHGIRQSECMAASSGKHSSPPADQSSNLSRRSQAFDNLQQYLLLTGSFVAVNTTNKFPDPQGLLEAFSAEHPSQNQFAKQRHQNGDLKIQLESMESPPPCSSFVPTRSSVKVIQCGHLSAAFRDASLTIAKLTASIKHARLGGKSTNPHDDKDFDCDNTMGNDNPPASPVVPCSQSIFPSPFILTEAGNAFRCNTPQWKAICHKAILGIPFALRQLWVHAAQSLVYNHLLGRAVAAERLLAREYTAIAAPKLGTDLPLLGRLPYPTPSSANNVGSSLQLFLCEKLAAASLIRAGFCVIDDEVYAPEGGEVSGEVVEEEEISEAAGTTLADGSVTEEISQRLAPSLLSVLESDVGISPSAFFFDADAVVSAAGENVENTTLAAIASQRATRSAMSVCGVYVHPHARSSIATATDIQWSVGQPNQNQNNSADTDNTSLSLSITFSLPAAAYATVFLMHLLGCVPRG